VTQFVSMHKIEQERTQFKHILDQIPQAIVIASNLDDGEDTQSQTTKAAAPKIQFCNLAA